MKLKNTLGLAISAIISNRMWNYPVIPKPQQLTIDNKTYDVWLGGNYD